METKHPETSYWFYFYWYCCFYPPESYLEPDISWDCDIDTFVEELKKLDRKPKLIVQRTDLKIGRLNKKG